MARDFALLLEGLEGNAMVIQKTIAGFVSSILIYQEYHVFIHSNSRKGRNRSGLLRAWPWRLRFGETFLSFKIGF